MDHNYGWAFHALRYAMTSIKCTLYYAYFYHTVLFHWYPRGPLGQRFIEKKYRRLSQTILILSLEDNSILLASFEEIIYIQYKHLLKYELQIRYNRYPPIASKSELLLEVVVIQAINSYPRNSYLFYLKEIIFPYLTPSKAFINRSQSD